MVCQRRDSPVHRCSPKPTVPRPPRVRAIPPRALHNQPDAKFLHDHRSSPRGPRPLVQDDCERIKDMPAFTPPVKQKYNADAMSKWPQPFRERLISSSSTLLPSSDGSTASSSPSTIVRSSSGTPSSPSIPSI